MLEEKAPSSAAFLRKSQIYFCSDKLVYFHSGARRRPGLRNWLPRPIKYFGRTTGKEVLAGLVERVTYHNFENGFCVLRAKMRGHRDVVTVVGHAATIAAGEWITVSGCWVNDRTHGSSPTSSSRASRNMPPSCAARALRRTRSTPSHAKRQKPPAQAPAWGAPPVTPPAPTGVPWADQGAATPAASRARDRSGLAQRLRSDHRA